VIRFVRAALFAVSLASCGGSTDAGDGGFSTTPYETVGSDAGKLRIEVRTAPQPPSRGTMKVELRVFDAATGAPQEDLTIDALPWMPAMGHGSSVKPQISATLSSRGVYVLEGVSMFMPGRWELRLAFSGKVADRAVPIFEID